MLSEVQPVFTGVPLTGEYLAACFIHNTFNVHIVLQFSKVSNFCHMPMHYYVHTVLNAYLLSHKDAWDAISVFAYLIAYSFKPRWGGYDSVYFGINTRNPQSQKEHKKF